MISRILKQILISLIIITIAKSSFAQQNIYQTGLDIELARYNEKLNKDEYLNNILRWSGVGNSDERRTLVGYLLLDTSTTLSWADTQLKIKPESIGTAAVALTIKMNTSNYPITPIWIDSRIRDISGKLYGGIKNPFPFIRFEDIPSSYSVIIRNRNIAQDHEAEIKLFLERILIKPRLEIREEQLFLKPLLYIYINQVDDAALVSLESV